MRRYTPGFAGTPNRFLSVAAFLFSLLFSHCAFSAVECDLIPAPDKNGNWGYVDAKTKKTRIAPRFGEVEFFDDGIAIVRSANGYYGMIDCIGRDILPTQYDSVSRAGTSFMKKDRIPGFFMVRQGRKKDAVRQGVVRADGTFALPLGDYASIYFYEKGYFRFDNSFWIDGQVYHPPSGHKISRFIKEADAFLIESVAKTSPTPPKMGVMRKSGEILIQPEYNEIKFVTGAEKRWVVSRIDSSVVDKLVKAVLVGGNIFKAALADMDEKKDMLSFWLLDGDGKEIKKFRARYHPFVKDGRVRYESGGREHEINPVNGELLVREVRQKVGRQYVLFRERGFWGVKNAEGDVLIKPQYVSMGSLGGDLFSARKIEGVDTDGNAPEYNVYAENIGVVNAANDVIMPFEYRKIEALGYPDRQTGAFLVGKSVPAEDGHDVRYGIADRTGRMIVPLQYDSHFYMNEIGHAEVYKNGRHGLIDHTGKVVLPLLYRSIFDTNRLDKTKSVFYMAEKDRLWGVYDATGKEIVPHVYGYVFISEENISRGWVRGDSPDRQRQGAYNYLTKVSIPAIYDNLRIYDHILVAYRRSEGHGSRDEYDLLDKKGRKFATWHYRLEPLPGGRFIVGKDVGKHKYYGVLDPKGKVLVEPKYRSMRPAAEGFLWVNAGQREDFVISETGEVFLMKN